MRRNVPFFSFWRVLLAYYPIHLAHEEFFIKRYLMHKYRVSINDLFDSDETFLFTNVAFKRLIKRMHERYAHLINQNFDLSAIVQDPRLTVGDENTAGSND